MKGLKVFTVMVVLVVGFVFAGSATAQLQEVKDNVTGSTCAYKDQNTNLMWAYKPYINSVTDFLTAFNNLNNYASCSLGGWGIPTVAQVHSLYKALKPIQGLKPLAGNIWTSAAIASGGSTLQYVVSLYDNSEIKVDRTNTTCCMIMLVRKY